MVSLSPFPSLPFFISFFFFHILLSQAHQQPQPFKSLKIQNTQNNLNSCSYKVVIKTSCSSTSLTRDKISLSFGDAYGNQVYAPRLDDPSSRTFERCSTDTFQMAGPCVQSRICYLYLLRVGSDGWKPDTVKVYYSSSVKFDYNSFVPYGVWFGFNVCNNAAAAALRVAAV